MPAGRPTPASTPSRSGGCSPARPIRRPPSPPWERPDMFVKICGTTSEEDALLAVAMGADAVGFIFAPSKRQIAPSIARDIAKRLPPEILTVGAFRDEAPQRVVDTIRFSGLKAVQLHGREPPEQARWIRERVPFVIQAFAAGDRMVA